MSNSDSPKPDDIEASASCHCSDDFDDDYDYDPDDEPSCHTCGGEGWVESVAEESGRWGWPGAGIVAAVHAACAGPRNLPARSPPSQTPSLPAPCADLALCRAARR